MRILEGLQSEGVEPVIIAWALTREIRTLSSIADLIATGTDLSAGMQKAGVWRNRQALVRACVSRHQSRDFRRLLKAAGLADQAAKGQSRADPWQLATSIVLALALGYRKAA